MYLNDASLVIVLGAIITANIRDLPFLITLVANRAFNRFLHVCFSVIMSSVCTQYLSQMDTSSVAVFGCEGNSTHKILFKLSYSDPLSSLQTYTLEQ